ncbi:MAG: hypothetical protein WBD53_09110 [Xanthobacteraceae bacterium]
MAGVADAKNPSAAACAKQSRSGIKYLGILSIMDFGSGFPSARRIKPGNGD